ncbi:MAG: YcaO-like family protein, partial [Pseudomonadota bacterium]
MAQSLIGTLPDALSRPNPRPAGQQRACPPQETLDALKPRFDELGIARLADITGLDRIGIPVVQAICPLSKSLTVKQGKGEDLAAAATSAAMEAAEAWHAESISAPPVADPEVPNCILDLSGLSPMPTRLSGHTNSISWIQGWDLLNGGPLWGPFDCITL